MYSPPSLSPPPFLPSFLPSLKAAEDEEHFNLSSVHHAKRYNKRGRPGITFTRSFQTYHFLFDTKAERDDWLLNLSGGRIHPEDPDEDEREEHPNKIEREEMQYNNLRHEVEQSPYPAIGTSSAQAYPPHSQQHSRPTQHPTPHAGVWSPVAPACPPPYSLSQTDPHAAPPPPGANLLPDEPLDRLPSYNSALRDPVVKN